MLKLAQLALGRVFGARIAHSPTGGFIYQCGGALKKTKLLVAGGVITLALVCGTGGRAETFQTSSRGATHLTVVSSSSPSTPIPEAGTLALFGSGLLALGAVARRLRRLGNNKIGRNLNQGLDARSADPFLLRR
jgi:PEP-CTERM motif